MAWGARNAGSADPYRSFEEMYDEEIQLAQDSPFATSEQAPSPARPSAPSAPMQTKIGYEDLPLDVINEIRRRRKAQKHGEYGGKIARRQGVYDVDSGGKKYHWDEYGGAQDRGFEPDRTKSPRSNRRRYDRESPHLPTRQEVADRERSVRADEEARQYRQQAATYSQQRMEEDRRRDHETRLATIHAGAYRNALDRFQQQENQRMQLELRQATAAGQNQLDPQEQMDLDYWKGHHDQYAEHMQHGKNGGQQNEFKPPTWSQASDEERGLTNQIMQLGGDIAKLESSNGADVNLGTDKQPFLIPAAQVPQALQRLKQQRADSMQRHAQVRQFLQSGSWGQQQPLPPEPPAAPQSRQPGLLDRLKGMFGGAGAGLFGGGQSSPASPGYQIGAQRGESASGGRPRSVLEQVPQEQAAQSSPSGMPGKAPEQRSPIPPREVLATMSPRMQLFYGFLMRNPGWSNAQAIHAADQTLASPGAQTAPAAGR